MSPDPHKPHSVIRPATEADLAAVAELHRLWEQEGTVRGLVADTVEDLRAQLGPLFLVAETPAGRIVAFAVGIIRRAGPKHAAALRPGTRYVDLYSLYVAARWRRRGLGSRLVKAVLEGAERAGVHRAMVYSCAVDWRRAAEFYERHGFHMWGFQMFR
jgi:ribosomal protein S18 acetylase RimI-like enzyme